MAEPITTLTDYAIALECLLFAAWLLGQGWVARLWAMAFINVGGAAFLGGTLHGFAPQLVWEQRLWLWHGMVLALAIASLCILVAVALSVHQRWRVGLLLLAIAKLALVLRLGTSSWAFAVSVADYLSALATVLLVQLGQLNQQHRLSPKQRPNPDLVWMATGLATSGLAASALLIPQSQALPLSPLAVYHLVQMVALYCIYRSARATGQIKGRDRIGLERSRRRPRP
ncbi:hypothetical protein IQ265_14660 [Nodosilinea sp. LEGE 06152]|uniref:DUF6962 family protein n=1 Tax=Nodosilinea sp. LEGE 06152 TaxID=2777966 RepID=UPI00187FC504|nr:hypothetical protein [Nodosilinea sp. LEGE 06152]MBE9158058.1 hypothetical protein [Nodosilinea sp. LEGE 06152]